MPWSIVKGGGTCSIDEYAVIKKSDGSTSGCHPNPEAAKKQLAALYANDKSKPGMKRGLSLMAEEQRGLPADTAGLEVRSDGAVDRFHGYAAVFNTRAAIGNPKTFGFYEQLAPSAFNKTLQESDVRMLIDHNPYYVVSRMSAGTLQLRADTRGLVVDSAMDDNLSYVRDLKANVRNGNITGMSFGFKVPPGGDEWTKERSDDGQDVEVRTVREAALIEVSGVTFPAYDKTQAALKSVAAALRNRGDLEAIERRAEYRPELLELCGVEIGQRTIIDLHSNAASSFMNDLYKNMKQTQNEPVDATRSEHQDDQPEPAASTQFPGPSVAARMRAMAARYHLPVG